MTVAPLNKPNMIAALPNEGHQLMTQTTKLKLVSQLNNEWSTARSSWRVIDRNLDAHLKLVLKGTVLPPHSGSIWGGSPVVDVWPPCSDKQLNKWKTILTCGLNASLVVRSETWR